jgi:hypothetical protein
MIAPFCLHRMQVEAILPELIPIPLNKRVGYDNASVFVPVVR